MINEEKRKNEGRETFKFCFYFPYLSIMLYFEPPFFRNDKSIYTKFLLLKIKFEKSTFILKGNERGDYVLTTFTSLGISPKFLSPLPPCQVSQLRICPHGAIGHLSSSSLVELVA